MEVEKASETAQLSFVADAASANAQHRSKRPPRILIPSRAFLGQAVCLLFSFTLSAFAQEFPEAKGYVNDYAHVLSAGIWRKLTDLCREVEEKTGAQIAVATVKTIEGNEVADYVNRLFEKWGVGKKGKDNGVMLFLALEERKVRIEVGYGLEGILPDITAGRILDNFVIPEFRRGSYDAGLLVGTAALAEIIAKDAGVTLTGAPPPRSQRSRRNQGSGFSLMQLLILFLIFGGSRWLWPLLFAGSLGGRRGGGWHGGWGGGFGGGFGGGGFGGFGGGGSGGGGAGRSF